MSDPQSGNQVQKMEAMLKRSLVTIKKLEAEVESLRKGKKAGPVAVIGMSCRMPGGIHSPEDLWKMLVEKRDAVTEIPEDRWDADLTYDPDPLAKGKTNTKYGAFLDDDVRAFDAGFFGISPREARAIDPIQRILLELTQEALEKAGIAPDSLRGSNTGVYLGIGNCDYAQARLRSGNLEDVEAYDTTGIPISTAAGRISYQFDFQGPSIAVDAACSSTLTVLHLAAEALRTGECDLAVVGSANLLLTPEFFVGLTKLGSLSPDGICRAFDEHGNGYVRGEGLGVILLKRLEDAQAADDDILALITGSAVVHDGLSNGYTAPNPASQADAARRALKQAGADPTSIGFVESHGVGNKFTDALELQTLEQVYGRKDGKLYVGSVKPNLGHMEAAIGMAMLAKVIGAIRHKQIPPNIHFETPNTDVAWDRVSVEVPTDVLDWPSEGPRRAAINLTSYNGTNTHLIVEEWTENKQDEPADYAWPAVPFFLSAQTAQGLRDLAEAYASAPERYTDIPLPDIGFTLAKGRSVYAHRLAVQAEDHAVLTEALAAWLSDGKHKLVQTSDPEIVRNRQIAMLFTGQGAQYPGMCKQLFDSEPVFRETAERCDAILKEYLGRSILEVMYHDEEGLIDQTAYTQPALFVVEYALAELWAHYGIRPTAVAGHSVGEYVALTVGGILKLEDALQLIAHRGRLIQSLPEGEGAMAAVFAGEQAVAGYLEGKAQIDIAAVNSPKSLTISGSKAVVEEVVAKMKEDGLKAVPLTVSHAFHSFQMDPILEEFESIVSKVDLQQPVIPVISNATGKELSLKDLTPGYFSGHIRGTVRFADDIRYLSEELGIDIFLEAGPNPTLTGLAKQCLDKPEALLIASAKKKQDDRSMMLEALCQLYLAGVKPDWKQVFGPGRKRCDLPTYPWQREVYWADPVHLGKRLTESGEGTPAPQTAQASGQVNRENLLPLMQQTAVRILGLEPGSQLDIYKSLREQGFDSMMSGELLATLEKYLGAPLEMSLIHVYGDLNSLHNYILKEVMGEEDSITMSEIMFDSGGLPGGEESENGGYWHTIREDDGPLMRWFKKIDRRLGVNDK